MKSFLAFFALLALPACGGDDSVSTTGDASPNEGGGGDGPNPMGEAGIDAAPSCGTGAWLTYGHDSRRTFTSDACIKGKLKKKWAYTPAAPMGRTSKAFNRAIAQSDAVFLQWAASDDPYTGTTGKQSATTGVDLWGQIAFDSPRLYASNVMKLDGPGLETWAFGVDTKPI